MSELIKKYNELLEFCNSVNLDNKTSNEIAEIKKSADMIKDIGCVLSNIICKYNISYEELDNITKRYISLNSLLQNPKNINLQYIVLIQKGIYSLLKNQTYGVSEFEELTEDFKNIIDMYEAYQKELNWENLISKINSIEKSIKNNFKSKIDDLTYDVNKNLTNYKNLEENRIKKLESLNSLDVNDILNKITDNKNNPEAIENLVLNVKNKLVLLQEEKNGMYSYEDLQKEKYKTDKMRELKELHLGINIVQVAINVLTLVVFAIFIFIK